MARGTRGLVGAIALFVALTPGVARAATVIEAQTVWRFDASTYTVAQGGAVTFRNADSASPGPHNVTAKDNGADGKPLFASETIPNGKEAPVVGVQQLPAGSYSFYCTVHPFMTATLTITGGGAPPSGSPPVSPPPPAASDTKAPRLHASLDKRSLERFLKTRRIRAFVTSDERADLSLRLTVRIGSRVATLATAKPGGAQPGHTKTVVLRANKTQLRALRRAHQAKLTLTVEGRDAAGNVGTAKGERTLRRELGADEKKRPARRGAVRLSCGDARAPPSDRHHHCVAARDGAAGLRGHAADRGRQRRTGAVPGRWAGY